ncbi:MAG: HAD-IIA family hydrolase [Spirochaetales bacterium]|nr:HAD-IIA family hydrolase [Spirochaetales bacterium]
MDNLILDIDGTLLSGTREINHSLQFLNYLEERGKNYILATNSIKSPQAQTKRFKDLGFTLSPEKFYSPIDSINQWIRQNNISHVMVVGSEAEIHQIKANHTLKDPELLVLLDFEKRNSCYNDLQEIINHLEKGCDIVAASKSPFYLKEERKQIDTGAFVSLIESIIGREIEILGKPSLAYFQNARSILCSGSGPVTVIGDDWKTDILGAKEAEFQTILVKSGKYFPGDESRGEPDSVIDDFRDLLE